MVEITLPIVLQLLQTAGILVGIIYYITIMRNSQKTRELTLESQELTRKAQEQSLGTRQAQLMMQLWNDYDDKFRESGMYWQNLEYDNIEDFVNDKFDDPDFMLRDSIIMSWYERTGVLVKAGLLDIHLIALSYAGATRKIWENLEPLLEPMREKLQYPRLWSETEYLCRELMKYMDEHPELKT
jgi:hypothetical protein